MERQGEGGRPLLWGPGTPAFRGKALDVPEALCYPRPIQAHIPILVGGSGEKRTLRLVAKYADACNLFGDAELISHKLDVLARHCADVGRDRQDIEVTQLSTTLVGANPSDLADRTEKLRPKRLSAEKFARQMNAGTVQDQIGRFRGLADVGVQTAIVSLPDVAEDHAIERFAAIIQAFAT
jgi:alkanesulfonate monooxygenase SsuD/methylene tetrahydromethanopterin reductase-like flavin-dependent oxidoreductase (luciferase family)